MEECTKLRGRGTFTFTQPDWRPALLLVASFLGCGGLVGPPPPPPNATVTVAPATASVLLGEPQTFTASVTNATNAVVSWSVNGIPGGNATVGTVTPGGVYTAPAILPSPVTVSVQAISAANTADSGASVVTVTSDISVSASPLAMSLELGSSAPLTATVNSAGNPNRSVTWVPSGSGCTGAACGTADSSGTYIAPQILPIPPIISLAAVSVADPSKSAIVAITVTSTFVLAVLGPSSVSAGNTATYTAAFATAPSSNPSRVISWSVTGTGCIGAGCGTISSSGVYTAPSVPPSPATVQILATPQADPTKAASISVSILPAVAVSVSPTSATMALGGTQTFQATVTGAQDASVTWDVNGVVGGNAANGSILNSQIAPDTTTYTAPLTMPAGGSVTVHARSNADPSVTASATVTFSTSLSVALAPASASLALNERQTFTAQVDNSPNQNVAWQVNGIPGGNSATGQICATGSSPCQPISTSNGATVDYIAPAGVPSPNPVSLTATSQANSALSASASVAILPHVVVSVQPQNVTMAGTEQLRFAATVTGTNNQLVIWSISGAGCGVSDICGSIDSTGLFTAPSSAPSPNLIDVAATSSEDTTQSATATVTIGGGPAIFSLTPTSAYAGSAGGFTLLVTGNNFSPSAPGPASTILVTGAPRATTCASATQCISSLEAADLLYAGNLSLQMQNPDGSLSNSESFVVLAPGAGAGTIPLTLSDPTSVGDDIVVVELSTNGGSGVSGNVSLNIGAIGPYDVTTSACALGGSPVIVQPPATGTGTVDLCVFSVSALDPSFTFTVTGPPTPDITVSNREPLGLGILHLTLQVPATAAPGPRTLLVQNPEEDEAAGTGAIEVQ